MRYASLEQYGVGAVLRVEQRRVAEDLREKVDALVTLLEVRVVLGEALRAARTAKRPPARHLKPKSLYTLSGNIIKSMPPFWSYYLDRWLSGDVAD